MRTLPLFSLLTGLLLLGPGATFAKGLNELSQDNPEAAEAGDGAAGDAKAATGTEAATAPPMVQSATSKALADKLFLATSFGWVKASKGEGDWTGSGMSDVTLGYKFLTLGPVMTLAGTFRYAPIAVSSKEDDQSYRGVWETFFVGTRLNYVMSSKSSLVGTGELGYTQVHLTPLDGQKQVTKAEKGGGQVALGGGADFQVVDKGLTAGPRLTFGVGSFTTIQVAGAIGFMF